MLLVLTMEARSSSWASPDPEHCGIELTPSPYFWLYGGSMGALLRASLGRFPPLLGLHTLAAPSG